MAENTKVAKMSGPQKKIQAMANTHPKTELQTTTPEKIDVEQSKTLAASLPQKALKPAKHAKVKMVRDSFTMPENDYSKFQELKLKCLENGIEIKKSELLRAGLLALSKLPTPKLLMAIKDVEKIKTGRPKKHRS